MKTLTEDLVATLQHDLDRLGGIFSTSASRTKALHPGERRTVAVLFMDLEGFREMSSKLDHEVLHKISSSVMGGLSRLVEFHGGHVDKIEGERIMALFGAEKAHENDCVRAVSCTMRMMEVVEEFGDVLKEQGFPIGARAGVSYGNVTVAPDASGHRTVTGDEVNVASRMEEKAARGTVMVTQAVRDEAGEQFQWDDLGEVPIKGKKLPVHTFQPTGPGKTQTDRWERAQRLASVPFVGRNSELSNLRVLLDKQAVAPEHNRRGGAKHIFAGIRGNAGIGKSRLIHEFMKKLDNATVLKAGCASYAQPPLWLIISAIRDWLDLGTADFPPDELVRTGLKEKLDSLECMDERLREDSAEVLSSLLSAGETDTSARPEDESGQQAKLKVQSSVTDLFRVLSDASDRLVVILDDVHWIDSASRELLEFLVTGCDTRVPILFILMYRPQPASGREIMEHLPEEYTGSTEMKLREIDADSSRELIQHLLSAGDENAPDAPETIVDFLIRSSGGNAFFIEELVLGMIESGLLSQDREGQWVMSAAPESMVIPGSIKGLVRARTDHLPQDARKLLQIASVLGGEFSPEILFRIAGNAGIESGMEDAWNGLVDRRFLEQDDSGAVRFGHVLVRDAVFETILKRNRRLLHSLCADELEANAEHDPGLAGVIARHRTDAGETERALPWAKKALDLANERYDGDAVIYWAERLEEWMTERLDSAGDARFLVEVLRSRQATEGLRLQRQEQRATLEKLGHLIREWNLSDLQAGYIMAMGNMYVRANDSQKGRGMFEQALQLFRQSGDKWGIARAISNIALCNKQMGLLEQAAEQQTHSISLFREIGDNRNIARSLLRFASTMQLLGRYTDGLEVLDEAAELAREAGIRTVEAHILTQRGVLQQLLGQREPALLNQQKALTLSREVGDRLNELSTLNSMCNVLLRMHRWDEARKVGMEALLASRELDERRTEANVLCSLGLIDWGEKRFQEAHNYFRDSLEAHIALGNKPGQAAVRWNLGHISQDLLLFEEGMEHSEQAIKLYKEIGNRLRVANKLILHSMILTEMGRVDEARACLDEYESGYGDIDDSETRLRLSHALGDLAFRKGELEEAEDHYRRSLELAREADSNELVPRSLQSIGMIRQEQGNGEEAAEYLRRGYELLDGGEYLETFLPYAEHLLRAGNREEAARFARMAYARARGAGNDANMNRSAEILMELGSNPE